ncbi:DUF1642 domain-containing protein [Pediococcus inopinatus]|uniref:DUF1642 domain-containing protein n=1 Tax=Pediococcus inopinatus TaxID=114090 RepID=UPI002B263641|nr:DUF1642 domain-containing protein [Pediococcus inopinatus]WPC19458.1 DUF1642 domain-containing protein [Pediococcus inopinatus]
MSNRIEKYSMGEDEDGNWVQNIDKAYRIIFTPAEVTAIKQIINDTNDQKIKSLDKRTTKLAADLAMKADLTTVDTITNNLIGSFEKTPRPNNEDKHDTPKLISKVKIPKFVADYIKYCKCEAWGIGQAMQPEYMTSDMPDKIERWFTDNSDDINCKHEELFAKAWIYGYEIEPEDKFHLVMPNTEYGAEVTCAGILDSGVCFTEQCFKNDLSDYPIITQSQIDSAPDWVKAIKPVKVKETDD